MSRYSADFEFNNFKNSLKSRGSRIVAIGDLAQQFEGFEAFGGGLGHPVLAIVRLILDAPDLQHATLEAIPVRHIHICILSCSNSRNMLTRRAFMASSAALAGTLFAAPQGSRKPSPALEKLADAA